MNKTKKYINLMVEVLLILSIVFAVLSIFVRGIVLNKNTYLNILNKNGTYEKVKVSVYDKIDKVLGSKNIDGDIKESILTEEDIKREADTTITGLIQYLKTGENKIAPIDTGVYKERTKEVLDTIIDNFMNPSKKDVAFNDSIQTTDMSYIVGSVQFDNMTVIKNQSQSGQDSIVMEKLMTSSEAEAKIRDLLKEKGLTEAQARQKMAEKGMSQEQALAILAGYGITIDESQSGGNEILSEAGTGSDNQNSKIANNNQDQVSSVTGTSEQGIESANGKVPSISNLQKEIIKAITTNDGTSVGEKLKNVENKVLDEAATRIDNEIQKINLSKLAESSKLQKVAKITSIFNKMFWLFMILPIILMLILIKLNDRKLYSSLRWIGNGFILGGVFILAIAVIGYASKIYENININTVYFNDIISITIKHLLTVLSTSGIVTFIIGVLLVIPTIKNILIRKARN